MPIDPSTLTALKALKQPAVAAYWKVIWDANDSAETRYYSDRAYGGLVGFAGIGVTVEPQILGSQVKDTLFEINPDLRSEKINITFNDIPLRGETARPISTKFEQFKSGVRCVLMFYFPDVDLTVEMWHGQLRPESYTPKTVKAIATNGFRASEQIIPYRRRPPHCTATYGGFMSSTEASLTNGCPVDVHLGGSIGNGDLDCSRDSATVCNSKCGTSDGKYFLGYNTDAAAVVTSGNPRIGPILSKGNASALANPIPVIYGNKYYRGNQLLLYRQEIGAPNPDHDWVSGISEVCEGPISQIYDISVLDGKLPQQSSLQIRLGSRGQAPISNWGTPVSNFSCTAHVRWKYGWINARETGPSEMTMACQVIGKSDVPVYTDDSPLTYSRTFSDNRVWCLFDLYTHQRYGMRYPHSVANIAKWITAGAWTLNTVQCISTTLDSGQSITYSGRRTTFDCVIEGRKAVEVIADICESGAVSIPFFNEGLLDIEPFRVATTDELNDAPIFTDEGEDRNICRDGDQPMIFPEFVPGDKLENEITITFENAANRDNEDSISVRDPNQQLIAGRLLGDDNLQAIPKTHVGYGIRHKQEAARLAIRALRFGLNDAGGTQNNLKCLITVPFIQALGLRRYQIIKIRSSRLDGFTIGTDDGVNDWTEEPETFRIMKMRKIAGGRVEIQTQAYNHTAYTAFETITTIDPPIEYDCSADGDCPAGYVCDAFGNCVRAPIYDPPVLLLASLNYDNSSTATALEVEIS